MVGKIILTLSLFSSLVFGVNFDRTCLENYDNMFNANKQLDGIYNSKDLVKIEEQLNILLLLSKITKDTCEEGSIEVALADFLLFETEHGLEDLKLIKNKVGNK